MHAATNNYSDVANYYISLTLVLLPSDTEQNENLCTIAISHAAET
jgi:hypothetical protein